MPGASEYRMVSGTLVADPKLHGGGVSALIALDGTSATITTAVEIRQGATLIDTCWNGSLTGGAPATAIHWAGKDTLGDWCATGSYTLRITDGSSLQLDIPISLVRLGVVEMDAQESATGNDSWQMVYFKKQSIFSFYATPAIHEYRNVARSGDVSDLDLNNGDPRANVRVNPYTDRPVMDGNQYDQQTYNYPLAYLMGSRPMVELTLGDSATDANGAAIGVGYPIPGIPIRSELWFDDTLLTHSGSVTPAGSFTFELLGLPKKVDRLDMRLRIQWQYMDPASSEWTNIEGSTSIPMRFYTLLGEPRFGGSASGTQYSGPWVEVADYYAKWNKRLQLPANTVESVTELQVKGFFGQNNGIQTAIEDVLYDAYPLGGDGGSTHYFNWSTWEMRLSRMLGDTLYGRYVNCTDNMGSTTTMLSMMGVPNMRPVHLGTMSLKAIWGIGATSYTTDLWGGGSHGFSYHHIVTDDDGVTVSDNCLQLDEDGTPGSTPGIPGWNHHRLWAGTGGYNALSSYNNTNTTLEPLPGVR
ncbi:MAG: hypothetical protein ACI841_001140 [Planctomycetota bacterium]|jgi:hypothetical protein